MTHFSGRRRFERLIALVSAVGLLMSVMVVFADAALAHHPEISANEVCAEGGLAIAYESISWRTDGGSGSAHNDIRIEVRVNGAGPWVQVGSGAYNAGNNYRFSGSFDGVPYDGQNIVVRARAVGPWINGEGGGETRSTSTIAVDRECTRSVRVLMNTSACAVDQQGAPRGAVTFEILPSSGATVQVYSNSNFTGGVGGALENDDSLPLAPGTYYWKATADSGFGFTGPSTGSFTIAPCQSSVAVVSGQCVVTDGVAVGSASVAIDPTSGATVWVYDSEDDLVATFIGSGGTASLAPGDYTWTASAGNGYQLPDDQQSGAFTIDPCDASVVVVYGDCGINEGGDPVGIVEVTIDPTSGAIVVITGPGGPYDFSGPGGSVELAPGSYSWTASPGSGFAISGPATGEFTLDPCTSTVSVGSTSCQVVDDVALGSATVSIAPASGANVVISGPGGPYAFSGDGGSVNLPPGDYTWEATPGSGFSLTGPSSGSFKIDPCTASVSVSGMCQLHGEVGSGVIEVTIAGSAEVSIYDGTTLVETVTSTGTITVDEGTTYTWSATPGSGFAIEGVSEGEVDIEPCSRSLQIVTEGECRNDVPYLTWSVTPINFTATETTITWLDIDLSNPLHSSVEPLSGEMIWPGAVVGGRKAIDWPGWLYVDEDTRLPVPLGAEGGTWIAGADGFEATRPLTSIRFKVNPSAVVEVEYPGGEPTCAGPPDEVLGEQIDPDDPDTLPFTGFDTEVLLGASLLMLGAGIILIQLALRREEG